ncbi:zinc finger protein 675-like isoform X2 [Anthonomus grandis grandis]|uniref:zinc finger protein 675-like isoform X2 n=1 Tax=Anthonomus grandis grandis TaxID=2921223 RepID=UPI0021662803|nr:zinc finger protein 675-like isoform X2 [Anthonomus grandis grandis]
MGRKVVKTCCACLKDGMDYNRLTVKEEGGLMLITKFKMCIVEVLWSPTFFACPDCVKTLDIVHAFRAKCIESDLARRGLQPVSVIKEETDSKVPVESLILDINNENNMAIDEFNNETHKVAKEEAEEEVDMQHEEDYCPPESFSSEEEYLDFNDDDNTPTTNQEMQTKEMKTQRRKRKTSFICDSCPKEFSSSTKLISHCKKTHGITENIRPYSCERCPQRFLTSSTLWQHIKYHEGVKSNMCSYCGKGFITKTDLTNHEKKHLNLREYKCDLCSKTFNTHKNIRTHKLIVHTDSSNWKFVCEICSKPFPIKSNYDSHMRRHTGDKKFECHLCDKKFAAKCDLQRHIKSHSDVRDYRCPHCKREYKDERVLKVHMAKIHSIGLDKVKIPERTRKYACNLCPKAYFAKNKLTRHLYGHSGEKPFSCDICDKKFKDKWYVKTHLKNYHNILDTAVKDEENNLENSL